MNATQSTEIVLSATEVAELIEAKPHELQDLHPAHFGVPGHWWMNSQGKVVYAEAGIAGLVDVLVAAKRAPAAARLHTKLVELRQERETPSRKLIS